MVRAVRTAPAFAVLMAQCALGVVTVVLVWTLGWRAGVVGLVLMQICSVLASLGPWGVSLWVSSSG